MLHSTTAYILKHKVDTGMNPPSSYPDHTLRVIFSCPSSKTEDTEVVVTINENLNKLCLDLKSIFTDMPTKAKYIILDTYWCGNGREFNYVCLNEENVDLVLKHWKRTGKAQVVVMNEETVRICLLLRLV